MKLLTSSEVEELVDHLSSRQDIWVLYKNMWVRRIGPEEYGLALTIKPAVQAEMFALTCKPVAWAPTSSNEYLEWLLEKYTAYGQRKKVYELISTKLRHGVDAHMLSRDICELQGGTFRYKYERRAAIEGRFVTGESNLKPDEVVQS